MIDCQMKCQESQRGVTLVELSIAMVLSVFLAGAVVTVQSTSTERFESSLAEHRVNAVARDGVAVIRKELRSCLFSSIVSTKYAGNQGQTLFSFQQAVSFDTANGTTNWGADDLSQGRVEYAVLGTDLIRRIVDEGGEVMKTTVMMDNLDLNPPQGGFGNPATFDWDSDTNLVTVEINRLFLLEGNEVRRTTQTLVYIDPVFNF